MKTPQAPVGPRSSGQKLIDQLNVSAKEGAQSLRSRMQAKKTQKMGVCDKFPLQQYSGYIPVCYGGLLVTCGTSHPPRAGFEPVVCATESFLKSGSESNDSRYVIQLERFETVDHHVDMVSVILKTCPHIPTCFFTNRALDIILIDICVIISF